MNHRLKELRVATGMTQVQLSEAAGLKTRMVQSYERDQRYVNKMLLRRAKALADALGCRIEDLLDEEDSGD
jgi:transcriptional regulator with XRE-family HTH domain